MTLNENKILKISSMQYLFKFYKSIHWILRYINLQERHWYRLKKALNDPGGGGGHMSKFWQGC